MSVQYPQLPDLDEDDLQFLNQLNQDDEKIRFVTLMNIADEEREELLPWLHHALNHDPASIVREEAAKRLEGWEDKETLIALANALTDASDDVVAAATQSLSEVKYIESAEILAPYLDKEDINVKVAILRGLKPLRSVALYDAIVAHVKHDNILVRREAVSALSWLQQVQAIDILADIIKNDTDTEIRRIATGGLAYAKQNSYAVVDALQHALTAEDWQLRVESALTAGKLCLNALENTLVDLLQHDPYWQVRIAVVRSLGLLKSKLALDGLEENFNHDISNLRKEIALALGEIGGERAEQLLVAHENDSDPEVRKSIRIGLSQIRGIALN